MPDPLTVLGGVSASLQLVEIATKTCLELYSFFRAVQAAGNDARSQIAILRGVQTTLTQISSYVESSHAATSSPMDSDIATLWENIQGLCDELQAAKALIPSRTNTTFSKVKWVLKRKEFASHMKDLESRKLNLIIDLEFISMRDRDTLLAKADDVDAAIRSMQSNLDMTNTATQDISVSMASLTGTISGSQDMHRQMMSSINNAIPNEGKETRGLIQEQTKSTQRIEANLSSHMATSQTSASVLMQLVQDLGSVVPEECNKINARFDDLFRMVESSGPLSRSTTTEYACPRGFTHFMARVAREEIRKTMVPVLKDLSQSQMRNEQLARHLEHIIDDVSMRLWNNSSLDPGPISPTSLFGALVNRDAASNPSNTSQTGNVTSDALQVVCAWPVSGQYGAGSRYLYYVLVAACVWARKAEWLRMAWGRRFLV